MLPLVSVYGTEWCKNTLEYRHLLSIISIPFSYYEIEPLLEEEQFTEQIPIIVVGATVLKNPTVLELSEALHSNGVLKPVRKTEAQNEGENTAPQTREVPALKHKLVATRA